MCLPYTLVCLFSHPPTSLITYLTNSFSRLYYSPIPFTHTLNCSYLKIIVAINRNQRIINYRTDDRLTQNGARDFKVRWRWVGTVYCVVECFA